MSLLMDALRKAEAAKRRERLQRETVGLATPTELSDPIKTFEKQTHVDEAPAVSVASRISQSSETAQAIDSGVEDRIAGKLDSLVRNLWLIALLIASLTLIQLVVGWEMYSAVINLEMVTKSR
jgi:hypothetical protein